MGATHRDGKLQTHQFGQHFGATHQRNAPAARLDHFRIVLFHRRRINQGADAFGYMGGFMTDEDLRAELFQTLGIGRGLGVGTLHLIADLDHDFGNAAHADAADANKVDGTEIERRRALGMDGHAGSFRRDRMGREQGLDHPRRPVTCRFRPLTPGTFTGIIPISKQGARMGKMSISLDEQS